MRIPGRSAAPRRLLLCTARLVGVADPVDVTVQDGRIAAIRPSTGGHYGLVEPAGGHPGVVELDGRYLVPGLWDAHVHLLQHALVRRRLDLSAASSAAHALALVRERLLAHPDPDTLGHVSSHDDPVLVGFGHRDAAWPDAPTTRALDDVAGRHAVVLVAGDLHSGWFSTAAQRRFGVVADASGVVREEAFFGVVGGIDGGSAAVHDAWIARAAAEAASRGVVGVVDMEAEDPRVWVQRAVEDAPYPLRVVSAVWPQHLPEVIGAGYRGGEALGAARDAVGRPVASLGPLKVISDGSLTTRTAYCHDPYPGPVAGSTGRGVLNVPLEELVPLMRRATAAGLACAIHAIGDAACGLALDAFAATGAHGTIEHAQLLSRSDVPRLAALGIGASVQPAHLLDDRDPAMRIWPDRADRMYAFAALVAAGVELTFGSDAPVAPLDPLLAIVAAVRRTGDDRPPWHPEQRLDAVSALAASTRGAGVRPTVGSVADLVVLDGDPLAWAGDLTAAGRAPLPVAGTLLAGEWTHRRLP